MNTRLFQELEQLSIAEKRSLSEALLVSADSEAEAPLITDAQRIELRARLVHHRENPNEEGITMAQLKANLLSVKSPILEAVHETATDLHRLAFINKRNMQKFNALCLAGGLTTAAKKTAPFATGPN